MAEEPSEDTSPVNSAAQEIHSSPNDSSQMKINGLTLEERFQKVRSIGEECIGEEELLNLLANKPEPICYDGFEPSGRMDIAQGVMKAISVNKLTDAGCKVKIWIADWFALLNNKMGGDLKKIQTVGNYFIEIWKSVGMRNLDKVEFLWCSEEINSRAHEYWPLVMDIARNKLPRIMRCCKIMGRSEQDELTAGQILYPCMQCADIFFLKADICQMGMDQREVNVLAREYCDYIKRKNKPIILSHHMLPGLQQPQEKSEKMSKSEPSSSIYIYMDDEEAEVNAKIKKAYCPPKSVEGNPCLEYIIYIVFPWFGVFEIEREENGVNTSYKRIEELIADYEKGDLHPADLKKALSKALNKILKPVRDHFTDEPNAKDLLKRVKIACTMKKGKGSGLKTEKPSNEIPSKDTMSLPVVNSPAQEKPNDSNQMKINGLTLEERFKMVRSIGEECIQGEELLNLLAKKPEPICYDGFEPSGRMHIAQGVMKAISVNKLTDAGCKVKIWVADWFAQLNNKMGGDLEKIQTVGKYFIEIWKSVGMRNLDKVEFLWCSEEINSRANEYWPLVMDIARQNTLSRIMRCCQIMGRSEQDELTAAQILYPCMQCADIFFLKADICQLGMDQRKVNVLAREYCNDIKRKNKPIILSHHMLPGLREGQEKMSKSDPSSSIYMEDEEAELIVKIDNAHCPSKIVEGNPCLEYIKYIVFPWFGVFEIENKSYRSFEELIADYENEDLDPAALKSALSKALNKILKPVRDHFTNDANAKDLLERVKSYSVTR